MLAQYNMLALRKNKNKFDLGEKKSRMNYLDYLCQNEHKPEIHYSQTFKIETNRTNLCQSV